MRFGFKFLLTIFCISLKTELIIFFKNIPHTDFNLEFHPTIMDHFLASRKPTILAVTKNLNVFI
jgi:hypothetical protein